MSGPAPQSDPGHDLVLDPGVLSGVPTLEINGWNAARVTGGWALLPWRPWWRTARQEGVAVVEHGGSCPAVAEVVVRIGKGRVATEADLAQGWAALRPGGRLLITGSNEIGISTWAKRIGQWSGSEVQILANRQRSRVVAVARTDRVFPMPMAGTVPASVEPAAPRLRVPPGVFSGDGLDQGTAALLAVLAELVGDPAVVVDLGCGAGHLGLAAAGRWPGARVHLLDADARAATAAAANALALGYVERCRSAWWDEFDPWPESADLVLCNPPAHSGTASDLEPALRLLRLACAHLRPGGRLVLVANRQLAYEQPLGRLGSLSQLAAKGGFKILQVSR